MKKIKSKEKLYFQEIRLPIAPPSLIIKSKKDKNKHKKNYLQDYE